MSLGAKPIFMHYPNVERNLPGIDIPLYTIIYDEYDELENGILEKWLENNNLTTQDVIDGCGINPLSIPLGKMGVVEDWATENGYSNPKKWVEEELAFDLETDYMNGKAAQNKINSVLNTDILYVEVEPGYADSYNANVKSPYWDEEVYGINYNWIKEDYNVDAKEARKIFRDQIKIAKKLIKSEFESIGWRPHSGGYTGSFYEE